MIPWRQSFWAKSTIAPVHLPTAGGAVFTNPQRWPCIRPFSMFNVWLIFLFLPDVTVPFWTIRKARVCFLDVLNLWFTRHPHSMTLLPERNMRDLLMMG